MLLCVTAAQLIGGFRPNLPAWGALPKSGFMAAPHLRTAGLGAPATRGPCRHAGDLLAPGAARPSRRRPRLWKQAPAKLFRRQPALVASCWRRYQAR